MMKYRGPSPGEVAYQRARARRHAQWRQENPEAAREMDRRNRANPNLISARVMARRERILREYGRS